MIILGSYVRIDRLTHRIIRAVRDEELYADPSNHGTVLSEGEDTAVVLQAWDGALVLYHRGETC